MSADASLGDVTCPRCTETTAAERMWLWVGSTGERIRYGGGSLTPSGHVDVFDLACGCSFRTELWRLTLHTTWTFQAPARVDLTIRPKELDDIDVSLEWLGRMTRKGSIDG